MRGRSERSVCRPRASCSGRDDREVVPTAVVLTTALRTTAPRRVLFGSFPLLRSVATGTGAPQAADGPAYEREEQSQDARDRKYRPQPLLRSGLLGALLRALGQGNARELVYEAHAKEATHYRQDQRHHQRQERHQEPVLEARAGRQPPGGVAPDQERQEQRYQEPDEGCGPALGYALASGGAEDGAHYAADYAAEDEACPQGGEPAQHDAHPARAPVGARRRRYGTPGAATRLVVPASLLDPTRAGPSAVNGAHLVLIHPRRADVPFSVGHPLAPLR